MFLRYDPYYRMIYDFHQNKQYSTLKHLTVFRRTPPVWGKLGHDRIVRELMIHDLDFITWLEKDIKVFAYDVITNPDNSAAVIDCLLSAPSFKVHIQGNSMLPIASPFSVGYEATFEKAFISYFEKTSKDSVKTECCIYFNDKKEKVSFEREEHCKAVLVAAIKDFTDQKDSGLSIENALPGLSVALELSHSI